VAFWLKSARKKRRYDTRKTCLNKGEIEQKMLNFGLDSY